MIKAYPITCLTALGSEYFGKQSFESKTRFVSGDENQCKMYGSRASGILQFLPNNWQILHKNFKIVTRFHIDWPKLQTTSKNSGTKLKVPVHTNWYNVLLYWTCLYNLFGFIHIVWCVPTFKISVNFSDCIILSVVDWEPIEWLLFSTCISPEKSKVLLLQLLTQKKNVTRFPQMIILNNQRIGIGSWQGHI